MHRDRPARALLAPLALILLALGAQGSEGRARQDAAHEDKALELRVTPRTTQSPGAIRLTARIARHPANRDITLEAESPDFFRSSREALEGAAAPTRFVRVFEGLPQGTYEVTARLARSDGTELRDVVIVEVFGPR